MGIGDEGGKIKWKEKGWKRRRRRFTKVTEGYARRRVWTD